MYNIPEKQITIIPMGINTNNFYQDNLIRKKIRNELKIKDDEIIILYAGKITPGKNPFLLLRAFNLISKKYPLKLFFVGDAEEKYLFKMKNFILENNLNDKVIFIPRVKNELLFMYYNAADLGIWPSQDLSSSPRPTTS